MLSQGREKEVRLALGCFILKSRRRSRRKDGDQIQYDRYHMQASSTSSIHFIISNAPCMLSLIRSLLSHHMHTFSYEILNALFFFVSSVAQWKLKFVPVS